MANRRGIYLGPDPGTNLRQSGIWWDEEGGGRGGTKVHYKVNFRIVGSERQKLTAEARREKDIAKIAEKLPKIAKSLEPNPYHDRHA